MLIKKLEIIVLVVLTDTVLSLSPRWHVCFSLHLMNSLMSSQYNSVVSGARASRRRRTCVDLQLKPQGTPVAQPWQSARRHNLRMTVSLWFDSPAAYWLVLLVQTGWIFLPNSPLQESLATSFHSFHCMAVLKVKQKRANSWYSMSLILFGFIIN